MKKAEYGSKPIKNEKTGSKADEALLKAKLETFRSGNYPFLKEVDEKIVLVINKPAE